MVSFWLFIKLNCWISCHIAPHELVSYETTCPSSSKCCTANIFSQPTLLFNTCCTELHFLPRVLTKKKTISSYIHEICFSPNFMLGVVFYYKLFCILLFIAKIYSATASSNYLLKLDRHVSFEPPNTTAKYFSNLLDLLKSS